VDTQTWSFNGNLRYRSNGFSIEGGLRYSIIKNVQTTDIFVSSPGNAAFGVPPFTLPAQEGVPADLQRFTNKPLTGGVTVSYEFNPRLNAYFAYGHSYRAGSTGVAVPLGVSRDLIRTKPEGQVVRQPRELHRVGLLPDAGKLPQPVHRHLL
jgi:iron complex outermembrane receptor protein